MSPLKFGRRLEIENWGILCNRTKHAITPKLTRKILVSPVLLVAESA